MNLRKAIVQGDHTREFLIVVGIALFVIIISQEYFFTVGPLHQLDQKHIDELFLERERTHSLNTDTSSQFVKGSFKDTAKVIIIAITQKTYEQVPYRWPWPRNLYAKLIKNLNEAGAKAIGIDIVMSNPDAFTADNDSAMMEAIREYRNVVVAGKIENTDVAKDMYTITSQSENFENIYFPADSSIGIVQVIADNDGVVRRYYPFFVKEDQNGQRLLPTFSFAVLNKYFDLPSLNVAQNTSTNFLLKDREIPKFDNTSMLINYYGTNKTFQHIDFWEILDDSTFKTKDELEFGVDINVWDDTLTADPNTPSLKQMFKDKIVLIGSTMPEDQDLRAISLEDPGMAQESFWDLLLKFKNPFQAKRTSSATAGSNMLYGVELHANAIQNIISGNYVYRLSKSLEVLLAVLLTFISFYLASILRKSKSKYSGLLEIGNILFLLALFLVFRYLSFYAFNNHSILVSIVSPNMAMILGYFGNTAYHFITERKQKGMIKGMFGQYVNVAIVDQLIAHPDRMQLGGERRNLSIFFSDIAGFSTFSEQKEPEDLVTFLNEYLSTMTQVVFDNHGTLDKYIGDAVMAFWNAPLPVENHAYCACKTALEMRKKLFVLREKWKKEGRPLVYARMGINTGDVVVGNVGGSQRFDYTVMGDNVNIASRLEGANKEYGTYIMITENTYEAVKNDFITRELDLMTVKGRTIPMKVYELIAFANDTIPQEQRECIERFEAGLVLFRSAKFEDAKALFQTNVERNDDYTSKMYIKRCDHFIANPPPPDWDGVFHMTTK